MAMVVKNNMSAVSTLNTLNKNSSALQKSLSKVSSGMKINSAQDDASGYAISERMRVQIRSLDQANQNTQNGSSLMKTAEGAVSSTVEILKSLKEKAINAANDTNKDSDRATIQKEIDQFIDQIDDNALTTFNGKYLVDGSKSFAGEAVATSFTNQALGTGTDGTTKLTALTNRNDESLEIESTDYVTASYVQNGKTETVKFKVEDKSLEDIFSALDSVGESGIFSAGMTLDKAKETFELLLSNTDATVGAATDAATAKAAINKVEDFAEKMNTVAVGVAAGTYTTADVKAAMKGTYTGTNADLTALKTAYDTANSSSTGVEGLADAMLKLSSTRTDGTKATAGVDDALTQMVSSAKDDVVAAVKNYLLDHSSIAFGGKLAADATTATATFAAGTDAAVGSSTSLTPAGTASAAATTAVTADYTDKSIATIASNIANDLAKAATVAGNEAVSAAGQTVTYDPNTAAQELIKGIKSSKGSNTAIDLDTVDKDNSLKASNNLTLTAYASRIGATLASFAAAAGASGGNIVTGKTDVIGTDAAGDTVYTADGTNGVTVTAGTKGLEGQISGITISITDSQGNVKKAANAALDGFSTSIYAKNKSNNNELSFQVGAAANQAIAVGLEDMRSEALGLKGSDGSKVSVATQDKANAAVAVFDNAIAKALDQQTTIGSIEARLSYTSENLTVSSENTQAAESTIRDADMAKEMTNYTKNNVLLQAAQSMLAQANQSSSAVLSLLQ